METEERGPGDGRRLAVGDAGFGEPWRRVGDEREFRLRPRKPTARNERVGLGVSLQNPDASCPHERELEEPVVGLGAGPKRTRPYNQRCAVRVMYAKNTVAGQWRALARERATQERDPKADGFDGRGESLLSFAGARFRCCTSSAVTRPAGRFSRSPRSDPSGWHPPVAGWRSYSSCRRLQRTIAPGRAVVVPAVDSL